jgi:pSer/pThr/pTyr-binding forkhead associated (FHA) protein
MHAALVMFKADGERREFPLTKPTTVVGRKPTCDLRIPLSSVSRQHCQIEIGPEGLRFRDLGSSNGTFYNGERKPEGKLNAGDLLDIGPVHFTVVVDGKPEAVKPVKTVLSPGEKTPMAAPVTKTAEPAPKVEKPQAIDATDNEMPAKVEDEAFTPTTELNDDDDDPIAALEALANAEEDDSDDLPIPMFDDLEDDKD